MLRSPTSAQGFTVSSCGSANCDQSKLLQFVVLGCLMMVACSSHREWNTKLLMYVRRPGCELASPPFPVSSLQFDGDSYVHEKKVSSSLREEQ